MVSLQEKFFVIGESNKILEDCENIFQNKLDNSALGAQATNLFSWIVLN